MIPFTFWSTFWLAINLPVVLATMGGGALCGFVLAPLVPAEIAPNLLGLKVATAISLFQVATMFGAVLNLPALGQGFFGSHAGYLALGILYSLALIPGTTLQRHLVHHEREHH